MLLTIMGAIATGASLGASLFGAVAVVTGASEATAIATGTLIGAGIGLVALAGDVVLDTMTVATA